MESQQAVLDALEAIEAKIAQIDPKTRKKKEQVASDYLRAREPLLKRRAELVSGRSQPTAQELSGYQGPSSTQKGVPRFWLTALKAEATTGALVRPHDGPALELLKDVRFVEGAQGRVVEFEFGDNPFFGNKVLRRGLGFTTLPDGSYANIDEVATDIDWHPGRSLLVREVAQGGKKGKKTKGKGSQPAGGDEGASVKRKAVPSFFRFFQPIQETKVEDPLAAQGGDPAAEEEDGRDGERPDDDQQGGEEEEEEEEGGVSGARSKAAQRRQEQMVKSIQVLDAIVKRVIPNATRLYFQGLESGSGGAEGDEGEEQEMDEDGFLVDSGKAAAAAAAAAPDPSTSPVLYALKGLQDQVDKLTQGFRTKEWELSKAADGELQALLDERKDLLSKRAHTLSLCPQGPTTTTSAPLFWLKALRASAGCGVVAARDEWALASLGDVRVRWDWSHVPTPEEPWRKCTVAWTFLDNPFFGPATFEKAYVFSCAGGNENLLDLKEGGKVIKGPTWLPAPGGEEQEEEEEEEEEEDGEEEEGGKGTGAQVSRSAAKRRKQKAEQERTRRKEAAKQARTQDLTLKAGHAQASFFNLFKPGQYLPYAFGLTSSDAAQALSMEEDLLGALVGPLTHTPAQLANMVELEEIDLGQDELEEDEDEEESGKPRKGRKKGGMSLGLSRATIWMCFIVLVLIAQLFAMIEMLKHGRR